MQLPPTDELVLVAGHPPVRARKLRYFEDAAFKSRVLAPPALDATCAPDLPEPRTNDWHACVRQVDQRFSALVAEQDEEAGGLEQARHPAHEAEPASPVDLNPADPLGLGEDEADPAADKRTMDRAAAATARRAFALDMADGRPGNLELEL
jgi:type IV secretion system protein VirD4